MINIEILKANIDKEAELAREIEIRLLEHEINSFLPKKKLDILRDLCSKDILDGNWPENQGQFDYIIAHLIPCLQRDLSIFFKEMENILTDQGIFLFSSLGKGLPYELEKVGDALLSAGFSLPVVDKEIVRWSYNDIDICKQDIILSGLNEKELRIISTEKNEIILEIEVIYAYASGKIKPKFSQKSIEIPIHSIQKRKF